MNNALTAACLLIPLLILINLRWVQTTVLSYVYRIKVEISLTYCIRSKIAYLFGKAIISRYMTEVRTNCLMNFIPVVLYEYMRSFLPKRNLNNKEIVLNEIYTDK